VKWRPFLGAGVVCGSVGYLALHFGRRCGLRFLLLHGTLYWVHVWLVILPVTWRPILGAGVACDFVS